MQTAGASGSSRDSIEHIPKLMNVYKPSFDTADSAGEIGTRATDGEMGDARGGIIFAYPAAQTMMGST